MSRFHETFSVFCCRNNSSRRHPLHHRKETAAIRQHGHLFKLCWNNFNRCSNFYSQDRGDASYFSDSENEALEGKRSSCIKILQRLKKSKINKQTKPQILPVLWPEGKRKEGKPREKLVSRLEGGVSLPLCACLFLFGNKPLYVCRTLPRMDEHTEEEQEATLRSRHMRFSLAGLVRSCPGLVARKWHLWKGL